MCINEEGWCVGLRQEGVVCVRVRGNSLKYHKRGWNRKEWRANKTFKRREGGQAGSRGGSLKKEGLEPPFELT